MKRLFAALAALALALPTLAAEGPGGELRLRRDERRANDAGPLAAAEALQPGIAPPPGPGWTTEASLRHRLDFKLGGQPFTLAGALLAAHTRPDGGAGRDGSRVDELHLSADRGDWSFSAGRKVVSWDTGYGFRPNDVVQQERRRSLEELPLQGRPLVMAERFGADEALSLVWVNPQRHGTTAADAPGGDEPALAARWYRRAGSLDTHLFARAGERTGASLGLALAAVVGESLELHASVRGLARHERWRLDAAAGLDPVAANPWQVVRGGGTAQWLLGLQWTGTARQSLMVEAWHDGTALADTEWDSWNARNRRLAALPLPAALRAGNLAWNAEPLAAGSLRRDHLFLRAAWQPEAWTFALDALVTPADRGRIVTASVQWQGDRLRLSAAWRRYGGPADAVFAQLPQRQVLQGQAVWAW